jgi:membrane protease YdiL (CAAX protease family)
VEIVNDPHARRRMLGLALAVELSLAAMAILIARPLGIDLGLDRLLRPDARGIVVGLAAAVPLLGVFAILRRWPWEPLRSLRRDVRAVVNETLGPCHPTDLAMIAVAAGLGEEILFRGLIQGGLAGWIGAGGALAVASVAFGMAHAVSPTYVVVATGLGLYLGVLFEATGGLVAPVVAHATYDLVALLVIRFLDADDPAMDSGRDAGPDPPVG